MADALNDLVSLADAKTYFTDIGQTPPSDAALARLITQISVQFQTFLDRRLVSQSYTDTIDGKGAVRMSAPNYPITAVSAVSVDGVAQTAASGPTACGFVFSATQVMLRGGYFCRGMQNVTISYTAGYTTIPADLVAAMFSALGIVISAQMAEDPRAVIFQAGGTKIEYGTLTEQLEVLYGTDVMNALSGYRRTSMGW